VKWRYINLWSLCCEAIHCTEWSYISGSQRFVAYSNKIESVGLTKCQYYHYLTKKVMLQSQTFRTSFPTSWRKNGWHRYCMKTLRHCHPMYTVLRTLPLLEKCLWPTTICFKPPTSMVAAACVLPPHARCLFHPLVGRHSETVRFQWRPHVHGTAYQPTSEMHRPFWPSDGV